MNMDSQKLFVTLCWNNVFLHSGIGVVGIAVVGGLVGAIVVGFSGAKLKFEIEI